MRALCYAVDLRVGLKRTIQNRIRIVQDATALLRISNGVRLFFMFEHWEHYDIFFCQTIGDERAFKMLSIHTV